MYSAPNATANPCNDENAQQFPSEEITYKTSDSKFVIKLSISESHCIINITDSEEHHVPVRKYSSQFTLEDLQDKSKFFKIFDSITETKDLFNHIFSSNNYSVLKWNNYLMLKLQIQSFKNEEVTLSIGQLMLNQETIINDLCDSMEKINKKFGDYYKKYEKMKSITQLLDDKIEEMIKEKNALNDEWEKKYSEKEKELEKIKEENKQLHAKIKKLTPKDKKPAKKNETKKEEKKIVQQEICTEVKV